MGPGCAQGVRGEAAVIDLGDNKTVFAILAMGPTGQGPGGPTWIADEIYKSEINAKCKKCTIFQVESDDFPSRTMDPSQLFTMVTFTDINDPASAIVVHAKGSNNPAIAAIDTVAQTFGAGFAFKGAVIEMASDAEVTRGVEGRLPWWLSKGRPAALALRSAGLTTGSAIDAEYAFIRK
jgi:hypothetical protein